MAQFHHNKAEQVGQLSPDEPSNAERQRIVSSCASSFVEQAYVQKNGMEELMFSSGNEVVSQI